MSANLTLDNDALFWNAYVPIEVTFDKSKDVNEAPVNALLPIDVKPAGILILVMFLSLMIMHLVAVKN